MEIITGPKGVGKTKQLVQLCMSDQNGVLVVKDVGQMVDRFIAWFGHVPKFEIISYNEYRSHSGNGAQYYFDDFDHHRAKRNRSLRFGACDPCGYLCGRYGRSYYAGRDSRACLLPWRIHYLYALKAQKKRVLFRVARLVGILLYRGVQAYRYRCRSACACNRLGA